MAKLSGRTAIVTGGASGMGQGVALNFAEEGARVAVLDRNEDGAKEAAEQQVRAAMSTHAEHSTSNNNDTAWSIF
mgnify:CR=1 FL=1